MTHRAAESLRHVHLKNLASFWAQQQGYVACATEVRVPNCGYRADLAAYKPRLRKMTVSGTRSNAARIISQSALGVTAVFECKQVRADFVKDAHAIEPTLARLKALDERRIKLEELLKVHHPTLRNGDSLFQSYDSYDFSKLDHRTYRTIIREIGVLQNRLYDKTKFDKLVRYRCANLYYLVVEEGLLASHVAPLGWGLLVHRAEKLVLERRPIWHEASESNRLALLQRIAVGGTRRLNREMGISFEEILTARASTVEE